MAVEGDTIDATPSLLGGDPAPAQPGAQDAPAEDEAPKTDPTPEGDAPKDDKPPVEETDEEKSAREAKEALDADAPEEYADFTMPEGFALAEGVADKLKAFGKDANLSQARVQQIVELGTELSQSIADQQAQGFADLREGWKEASRTDEEFGGTKLQESLASAAAFRDAFGSPELIELLNSSGMGDHPEVVRLFARAGKAMADAKFVTPGKTEAERPLGSGFFTNSNMKD